VLGAHPLFLFQLPQLKGARYSARIEFWRGTALILQTRELRRQQQPGRDPYGGQTVSGPAGRLETIFGFPETELLGIAGLDAIQNIQLLWHPRFHTFSFGNGAVLPFIAEEE